MGGLRQDDLRFVGVRAIEQHDVAQHLRDLAAGALSDRLGGVVAVEPGGLADLDLHELVIDERLVDRSHEPLVDAAPADLDDRSEVVAKATEVATLLAGEHGGL
jgi:hypothetical protein